MGNFIVCWDNTFGFPIVPEVFFQRFDSIGNKIGRNIKVTDDPTSQQSYPSITGGSNRNFIITWIDTRKGPGNSVYMQMYDSNANRLGMNSRVNDVASPADQFYDPQITSDSIGRFTIAFSHVIAIENKTIMQLQLYNITGSRNGNNKNISSGFNDEFVKALSKQETGEMVVAFMKRAGVNNYPFFKRLDTAGNAIGSDYLVSTIAQSFGTYYSDVKLYQNRILSVWNDNREGNDDLYCNIRSFINPDSLVNISNISNEIPPAFELYQNYPNPFNPQTNIPFDVKIKSKILLKVFDITGKEIIILFNNYLEAGKYEINLNINQMNLSSGIYFYSLVTDKNIISKRMTIIK